ncbi:MAG: AAA family ATPase [Actinomycetota bacterium]|nr:AAA family ATPase [Actinomycetota bacterium]
MGSLKVGIVGKGGVGKTTVSALLARAYTERGARVVAIDTDSNPNLGLSLGLSLDETESVPVLPRALLVGAGGTTSAGDVVAEYGRATPAGPTLLSAIRVTEAAQGCTCGGHATVRGLLSDALAEVDVTLVDMEAGLEHLSRSGGTLAYSDVLLVVCEPTRKSVLTATRTAELAADLGIPEVLAVGNKARTDADVEFFRSSLAGTGPALAAVLPFDADLAEADRQGAVGQVSIAEPVRAALDRVIDVVDLRTDRRVDASGTESGGPAGA